MASSALETWVYQNIPAYKEASPQGRADFLDFAKNNAQSLGTDALRAAQQDTSTLSALGATTGRNLLGYANLPFVATGSQAPEWITKGLEYTKNPRFQAELPTGDTLLDKAGYLGRSLGLELGGGIIDPANLIPIAGLSKVGKATSALAEAGKVVEAGAIPTAKLYQEARTAEQLANTSALARAGEVFAKNAPIGGALSAVQSYGVNNGEVNPMEVLAGGAIYGGLGAVLGGVAQRSLRNMADEKLGKVFSPDLGGLDKTTVPNFPENMRSWGQELSPTQMNRVFSPSEVSLSQFGEMGGKVEVPQGRVFPSPDAESLARYNAEAEGVDMPYAPEARMETPAYDMAGNEKAVKQFIKDEVSLLPKEDRDTFFKVSKESGLTPKEQVDFINQLKTERQVALKDIGETGGRVDIPTEKPFETPPARNADVAVPYQPEVPLERRASDMLGNPKAVQQLIKDEVATLSKSDRDTFFKVSRESGLTPQEQIKFIDQMKGRAEEPTPKTEKPQLAEARQPVAQPTYQQKLGDIVKQTVSNETSTPIEKPQIEPTPTERIDNGLQVKETTKEVTSSKPSEMVADTRGIYGQAKDDLLNTPLKTKSGMEVTYDRVRKEKIFDMLDKESQIAIKEKDSGLQDRLAFYENRIIEHQKESGRLTPTEAQMKETEMIVDNYTDNPITKKETIDRTSTARQLDNLVECIK